jgi:predicted chitinase
VAETDKNPKEEEKRSSFAWMESLTKLAAVLGAFIAVGQAGSEAIRGYFQRESDRAKAVQELEMAKLKENSKLAQDYIQLLMAKDVQPADRVMLLGALKEIRDHPLQKWAQERYDGIVKNIAAINQARELQLKAIGEKDENERKAMNLQSDIAVLNERINGEKENLTLVSEWQQQRRVAVEELAKVRGVVGVAVAKVETRTTVIARTETGASSASDVKDRAADITALMEKVDTKLLLTVFPPSAEANIDKYLPFVKAALQEFQVSDKRLVAGILATVLVETGSFLPSIDHTGPNTPYRSRGFILMTGLPNYEKMSKRLGLGTLLVDSPEEANSPQIAARILCAFFVDAQPRLKNAFENSDVGLVYRIVTGSRPPERFAEAYGKLLAQL